ncbi:unnamed protein product [Fusarium venenatum]|uniref:Uncharacterized protein n=1 Tax=Fusarium venenatum TaxID=56646 RepID=A0A2L2T375_9HYPO|nr:uncharacterized protein FVRRES_00690 [Fusarium venenatum]CEI64178.1 unnamed protein product [Fusarium venenatum]
MNLGARVMLGKERWLITLCQKLVTSTTTPHTVTTTPIIALPRADHKHKHHLQEIGSGPEKEVL